MPVPGHIAIELVTEAALALTNGDLNCHPQCAAQARITAPGQLRSAAILTRLVGGQIQTAEFEKLPMMTKTSQITCLGQDCQGMDRPDAWYLLQTPEIGMLAQQCDGRGFNVVALGNQAPRLSQHQPEHPDRRSIRGNRQGDGCPGCVPDVAR